MEMGDRHDVNEQLSLYKERNVVQFDKVLLIPSSQRIPALVKEQGGRRRVVVALSAAITSAFGSLNLRVGMNDLQIVDLAEAIVEESNEDNLSLEDVLLFLQQLISGKAGKIYDRMDVPTFMELFENYRQERYVSLLRIREEQNAQYKAFGDTNRESENKDRMKELHRSQLGDYLRNAYSKDKAK